MSLKTYLVGLASIVLLDFLWLGVIAQSFYQEQLGELMVRTWIVPGLIVWALIALGVYLYALPKADSFRCAFALGGFFGFLVYAIYDLTNVTFLDWPLRLAIVDIVWGSLLCALLCVFMYGAKKYFRD